MSYPSVDDYRSFLKSDVLKNINSNETDQGKNIPQPPLQKGCIENSILIDLIAPKDFSCAQMDLLTILRERKSRRVYSDNAFTLEELSFLLWSTQGVKKIINNGYATFRTVPSAGARHALESYIAVFNVEGLEKGIYRYLALEHKLVLISKVDNLEEKLSKACFDQAFVAKGAVTFIWATIPYRMEWRYSAAASKLIAIDAGHVCQNLYLAAESINAGVCAIASYDQTELDSIINIDGKDEFSIYVASVGRQLDSK